MKKLLIVFMILSSLCPLLPSQAYAENTAVHGKPSESTFVTGLSSLILWPGIGQYLNGDEPKKCWTHAAIGIVPIFRFWSGWDAFVDRKGGRWNGKI